MYPEIIIKGEPLNFKKRPNTQTAIGYGLACKLKKTKGEELWYENLVRSMEVAQDRKMFAQRQKSLLIMTPYRMRPTVTTVSS